MNHASRVEQICDVAETLFSQQGYHATSVRNIARELNLQGGSLYAHIDSKEDVLWAIVDRAADQFLDVIEPVVDSGLPPRDKLIQAIEAHIGVVARNPDAAAVYFHEWRFLSSDRRQAVRGRRDEYEAFFRQIIVEGVEQGIFRPVDEKFAGLLVLSVCNWFYQWYDHSGALSSEEIAERFTDMILCGLLTDAALRPPRSGGEENDRGS